MYLQKLCKCDSDAEISQIQIDKKVTQHKNWKLLPTNCGVVQSTAKIVGGKTADFGQFPWLARLGYNRTGELEFKCGAALLTTNCVLTVAHCIVGLESELVLIRVGENNIAKVMNCQNEGCAPLVQDREPLKLIVHPKYYPWKNDIALIQLDRDVVYHNSSLETFKQNNAFLKGFVLPICLPTDDLLIRDFVSEKIEVAGWGYTNWRERELAEELQFVQLPVRDLCACAVIYNDSTIDGSQLCVGLATGQDSCNGDSGGPLMKKIRRKGVSRTFVIGLVSYGKVECGEGPAVYTNVPYFMLWILDSLDLLTVKQNVKQNTKNTNTSKNINTSKTPNKKINTSKNTNTKKNINTNKKTNKKKNIITKNTTKKVITTKLNKSKKRPKKLPIRSVVIKKM